MHVIIKIEVYLFFTSLVVISAKSILLDLRTLMDKTLVESTNLGSWVNYLCKDNMLLSIISKYLSLA